MWVFIMGSPSSNLSGNKSETLFSITSELVNTYMTNIPFSGPSFSPSTSSLSLATSPRTVKIIRLQHICQGRGSRSRDTTFLARGSEGTGWVCIQQKSDTAFRSTLSGSRYVIPAPKRLEHILPLISYQFLFIQNKKQVLTIIKINK